MKSNLEGPYELSYECLESTLPRQTAGVFALGYVDPDGRFRVNRVGREDGDLRDYLRGLIGSSASFKFSLTGSAREAFDLECELFHRLRPPGNFMHPVRPPGSSWKCRHCLHDHA